MGTTFAEFILFLPIFFRFRWAYYARLTLNATIWNRFVEGECSVNKSNVPFSLIGADHALEHENRAVKVLGGIKGIANSQKLLDEYFLTAAEMSSIVEQFCPSFLLEDCDARKREQHYQLIGSKNSRLSTNANKLDCRCIQYTRDHF